MDSVFGQDVSAERSGRVSAGAAPGARRAAAFLPQGLGEIPGTKISMCSVFHKSIFCIKLDIGKKQVHLLL